MTTTYKHTDLLSREKLDRLLSETDHRFASIYMPTHPKNGAIQDPIRYKNLLKDARKDLVKTGMKETEADQFLKEASKLAEDNQFWQFQSDGLAVFISHNNFYYFRLPIEFDEKVYINNKYYIRPVMPLLTNDGVFYILAISKGSVRLLQGTRYTIKEVHAKDLPQSFVDILKNDQFITSLQFHTGTSRPETGGRGDRKAIYHGQGSGIDKAYMKRLLTNYLRHLDDAVCDMMREERAPLILAGMEFIQGLYREGNHYDLLLDDGVDCNPQDITDEELLKKSWEIVEPIFRAERKKALDQYYHLAGTNSEKACNTLERAVPMAYFKRVDTLFVPRDKMYWGRLDAENNTVIRSDKFEPGNEDLLNMAVFHTVKNRGRVYSVNSDEMPELTPVMAILR